MINIGLIRAIVIKPKDNVIDKFFNYITVNPKRERIINGLVLIFGLTVMLTVITLIYF
jgi:hypothetical protein